MRIAYALSVGAIVLFLGGCSTPSQWETSFVGHRGFTPPARKETDSRARAAAAEAVRVREGSRERIDATIAELRAEAAASDVHPEEWPAERKAGADERLLRALQVADPARVVILGRSAFRTTDDLDPRSGALATFAARLGATDVIWTGQYVGKADKIVDYPVTTHSTGWDWFDDRHDRRHRGGLASESSTAWVPVRVSADQWEYFAFYLKATQ